MRVDLVGITRQIHTMLARDLTEAVIFRAVHCDACLVAPGSNTFSHGEASHEVLGQHHQFHRIAAERGNKCLAAANHGVHPIECRHHCSIYIRAAAQCVDCVAVHLQR